MTFWSLLAEFLVFFFFLPFTTLTFLKSIDQICTAYPPFWVCWFSSWLCSGYAFWFRNTMVVKLKWCCVFLRTSCLTLLTLVTWLSWYLPLDTSLNTGKLVLSFYGKLVFPGRGRPLRGGHGNSCQYSCLENSMHRGFWWIIAQGVAKSRTRLGN